MYEWNGGDDRICVWKGTGVSVRGMKGWWKTSIKVKKMKNGSVE